MEYFSWMKAANEYGVWDFLNTLVLVSAVKIAFFPKRRVPHLNFYLEVSRGGVTYPLKILIQIRNHTGQPCLISFASAVLDKLRPHPSARGDSASKTMEVRFQKPEKSDLTEVETFIRHGEVAHPWIALDPQHTDDEINEALEKGAVGKLKCTCTWLGAKVSRHPLSFSLRR